MWLCSIAKKILFKKLKKDRLNNTYSIENVEIIDNNSLEEEIINTDINLSLYKALQKLDADTRDVIYLKMTKELTFKQIGKIMNKSENWAKVKFFRGKQKLIKEDII